MLWSIQDINRIFVGNLSWSVRNVALKEHFTNENLEGTRPAKQQEHIFCAPYLQHYMKWRESELDV